MPIQFPPGTVLEVLGVVSQYTSDTGLLGETILLTGSNSTWLASKGCCLVVTFDHEGKERRAYLTKWRVNGVMYGFYKTHMARIVSEVTLPVGTTLKVIEGHSRPSDTPWIGREIQATGEILTRTIKGVPILRVPHNPYITHVTAWMIDGIVYRFESPRECKLEAPKEASPPPGPPRCQGCPQELMGRFREGSHCGECILKLLLLDAERRFPTADKCDWCGGDGSVGRVHGNCRECAGTGKKLLGLAALDQHRPQKPAPKVVDVEESDGRSPTGFSSSSWED